MAAEDRFSLVFPADYREFLATLHTPDPAMLGARFEGANLVPFEGRMFPDWTGDPKPIEASVAWPLEGLLWSIEDDESWHPRWGPRPRGKRQREALVRDLAAGGPQLIPVFGHRYLAGRPDRNGNPVLSMYGSDVILYAPALRSYLPLELGLEPRSEAHDLADAVEPIPFWQDVIDGLPWYFE